MGGFEGFQRLKGLKSFRVSRVSGFQGLRRSRVQGPAAFKGSNAFGVQLPAAFKCLRRSSAFGVQGFKGIFVVLSVLSGEKSFRVSNPFCSNLIYSQTLIEHGCYGFTQIKKIRANPLYLRHLRSIAGN